MEGCRWTTNSGFSSYDRQELSKLSGPITQEKRPMSAPSRRPEIRRRRTRKEKVLKLRKRLAAASNDNDRNRLTGKLHRLELVSPGNPLIKS
jgi:hypothetical protein